MRWRRIRKNGTFTYLTASPAPFGLPPKPEKPEKSHEIQIQSIPPSFLRHSLAALLTLAASSAFADTVSSSADVRVISFNLNSNDVEALSLYNESSGTNTQRTFLNFDLSSYSGNSITTDATMTLTAGVFGNFLTGVSLGTANSAWTQAGITWSNQPSLTPITGATNPDGTFGSGPVTWTIP